MVSFPSRPEVVVIGAGAAGIAAGRTLARQGVPFLILEARDRVGGRAQTQTVVGGQAVECAVDLGCGWLHSADGNVIAGLARLNGIGLDTSLPPWRKRQPLVGFDLAAQDDFARASEAFFARLEQAAQSGGADRPAAAMLEPGGRWNGLLGAISTYYNGAPLARVSVADFDRYTDTEVNWRVDGGLGAFVGSLAAGLPIHTGCRVTRVDATARDIRIETDTGTIKADKVVVTVPTNVIAAQAIGFDPALDPYVEAAAGLPLGVADKVFFALDDAETFAPDTRLFGNVDRVDAGSYTLRARGLPLVEGYFGGDFSRELEKGGLDAFADAARSEIAEALGRDLSRKLHPLVATTWAQRPFSLGSYSHALPGRADARARLATPFEDRILFAGEATSPHFFSTVHGAWEEGERAARRVAGRSAAVDLAAG